MAITAWLNTIFDYEIVHKNISFGQWENLHIIFYHNIGYIPSDKKKGKKKEERERKKKKKNKTSNKISK